MSQQILVIEDDPHINALVCAELARFGYTVASAKRGDDGLAMALALRPALLILDAMLPGLDGFEVCRQLRQTLDTPVILLTARDAEIDRVLGLELGADDYVVKPFSLRELIARVKARLRVPRAASAMQVQVEASSAALRWGDCLLHVDARRCEVQQQVIELSRREFDLLHYLLTHPGRVLTREWLLSEVWGRDYDGMDRTVDMHVLKLRDKLGRDSAIARAITAVRGIGYRLDPA
jgi:two-component system, OmpR family, response regulator VicR